MDDQRPLWERQTEVMRELIAERLSLAQALAGLTADSRNTLRRSLDVLSDPHNRPPDR